MNNYQTGYFLSFRRREGAKLETRRKTFTDTAKMGTDIIKGL
jgi:hypothetical protein